MVLGYLGLNLTALTLISEHSIYPLSIFFGSFDRVAGLLGTLKAF